MGFLVSKKSSVSQQNVMTYYQSKSDTHHLQCNFNSVKRMMNFVFVQHTRLFIIILRVDAYIFLVQVQLQLQLHRTV